MSSRTRPGRLVTRGASRSRRSRRRDEDEIPEVYTEMLAEAEARGTGSSENDRPNKRFKPAGYRAQHVQARVAEPETPDAIDAEDHVVKKPQIVYNSPSESDESDMEWEEVDIQQPTHPGPTSVPAADDAPLQITLGHQEDQKRSVVRRKPVTAAEKKVRLDVHKTHLLCLLGHVQRRNLWCNDEEVQDSVKKMLSRHIRSQLNPPEDKPQHTRSAMFLDGLNQAGDVFTRKFRVTKPGLRRAHWAYDFDSLKRKTEGIMSDAEVFLSKEDFRKQAKTLQGSRDFGAQLFCALLRSVAVEARVVCSLQPLPFSGTMQAAPKPKPQAIVISSDDPDSSTDGKAKSDASKPSPIRRLGRPTFKTTPVHKTFAARPTPSESSFPVFWVEAFNEAFQKWIVIDPMVTKTLAKPQRLEPPSTDPYNLLSYVVAFEEDASARDVTRRYTKFFNSKIRKLRVESTKNGEVWWRRVLQHFERPFLEDRDEIEIGELTSKTASEPMPRNVQDFKDHPIYALERHLRRNEVIFPKRVAGQVSVGKAGAKGQSEPVYRRSDVHALRSANKWYRLGRDIKMGEQALKRTPARSKGMNIDDAEDPEETALYAFFQTEPYKPPPVVQGKIPKNVFGNLDIYVPNMVPPGGVHMKNPDAGYASRLLGIDYADAVTGFNFKGRHGTAVIQGAVVASEYQEAVEEVLKCLQEERQRNDLEARSAEALRTWKHFLLKLRIVERVRGYAVEGEADDEASGFEKSEGPDEMGGGFFPEPDAEMASPPRSRPELARSPATKNEDMGGGFLPELGEEMGSPVFPQQIHELADAHREGPVPLGDGGGLAGGFIPEGDAVRPSVTEKHPSATARSRYSLVVVPSNIADVPADQNPPTTKQPDRYYAPANSGVLGDSVDEPITVASSANGSASASIEILSRAPSQVQSRNQSVEAAPEHSEISENEGSLLSEDPEDEDAVPEWLMSDQD
ncbi:hypothetical protein BJX76DRAFT_318888 [Aspergillus varians]